MRLTGPARPRNTNLYVAMIEAHVARIGDGRDPHGHLFAIERLARGARAELAAEAHHVDRAPR